MNKYYNKLRAYQQEDVQRILQHIKIRVGVFNQQRTGKTPTSIVALTTICKKIVVVAPASMTAIWSQEVAQWSNHNVYHFSSTLVKNKRLQMIDQFNEQGGCLIISYDLYRSEQNQSEIRRFILKCKPDGLIADEAHRAVGRKTKSFKALKQSKDIPNILLLSGTPAPNHPAQVWSLLHILQPKVFSSYWRFVESYFVLEDVRLPRHMLQRAGMSHIQEPSGFIPDKEKDYVSQLHANCIMRKRADVMPWLPKQEEIQVVKLDPTTKQKKHIKDLTKYFKVGDIRVEAILDQLTRLRQLCTVPSVFFPGAKNPKTAWLNQYLSDYPDKSIIIFSRFTTYLKRLNLDLKAKCGLFVGGMSGVDKRNLINDFQGGNIKVLLVQIDAGKEGITLDKASTLIFTDVFPPVGDIDQAKDRIIATSKDNVKPYNIIGLCIKDTYDEDLYTAYKERKSLTDVANDYINYIRR